MAEPTETTSQQAAGTTPQLAARRRFLKGGAAVAPVVLSVTPGSVLATGSSCTAASAFASINASRPDIMSVCSGKKPDWWKDSNNHGSWGSPYTPSKPWGECGLSTCTGISNSTTLLQVLSFTETTGPKYVAKHIVAALLNAKGSLVPVEVLNEAKVKSIWNSFVAGSFKFSPTAGVTWYDVTPTLVAGQSPGGVTGWLLTTMV